MGSKPASGFMPDRRFRSREVIVALLLCLLAAGCGGPAGDHGSPTPVAQTIEPIAAPPQPPDRILADRGTDDERARREPDPSPPQPMPVERQARDERQPPAETQRPVPLPGRPFISASGKSLQCVPYARKRSGISIRGDAWTWWRSARGQYRRGRLPAVGAVMVLKRRGRGRGHLAVVTHVIGDREIIVDHANWLNRGRIHRNTPVRDVSAANDWSAIRVWHVPTRRYGVRTYRAYGFVYPVSQQELTSALPRLPDRG